VGVAYDLYLYVVDADSTVGVAGASFGLSYDGAAQSGIDVFSWTRCADMEFPGGDGTAWPDSGSGNVVTWDHSLNCQATPVPGDQDGGVGAVLGTFYVYAYSSDVFQITPRNYVPNPDFDVSDCNGAVSHLTYPGNAGEVGFGGSSGRDPCLESESLEGGGGSTESLWSSTVRGTYVLNEAALASVLTAASSESIRRTSGWATVTLPHPSGRMERYLVKRSPILSPAMAAANPTIRTYVAQGIDDPTASGRLDKTVTGFHAMILSKGGSYFIDPAARGAAEYTSYLRADRPGGVNCLLDTSTWETAGSQTGILGLAQATSTALGDSLYTYRLAINTTGEYTQYFGSADSAQAEVVTAVNRVNAIFERDLAMQLVLVFTQTFEDPATDPFVFQDVSENQAVTDDSLGAANYDVGHLFHYEPADSNGYAPGRACIDGTKAKGRIFYPDLRSSVFISYFAHELGHMFAAEHTMNLLNDLCPGGRREEPASGSTIMSYAGAYAGSCNVEPTDQGYFHGANIGQIASYTRYGNGRSCAVPVATGNQVPSISALTNHAIPQNTPFFLSATATDLDGDSLTYCWEQIDTSIPPTEWPRLGPLFRSRLPASSGKRTFPPFEYVLSGPPTSILDIFELLPELDRDLSFRVTVRDNRAGMGAIAHRDVTLRVRGSAFRVTYPNGGESFVYGDSLTVTWSTGEVDSTGTQFVDVLLLLDDDEARQYPLKLGVPNDGSERIMASIVGNTARILIQPVGNVYFDVSDSAFSIGAPAVTVPDPEPAPAPTLRVYPNPSRYGVAIRLKVPMGSRGSTTVAVQVRVVDVLGRVVRELAATAVGPGDHRFRWDARDTAGRRVGRGIYFVVARIGSDRSVTQKVLIGL